MTKKENVYKLRCEKLVNETWGKIATRFNKLEKIFEQGGPKNSEEHAIIIWAAYATLQRLTLDRAIDEEFTAAEVLTD